MGFYVPGAISLLMGIVALFTIKDRPGTLGLPNVGQWRNDPTETGPGQGQPGQPELLADFCEIYPDQSTGMDHYYR
ncbi:regulatory protein UhpC [Salmonella enterica subsp. enterica serovar Madelia]|nr:regulatory protein UhpC [Salmonella enterica subsp. enterica serovar Madelia]